jgi:5-methylcytosine-specific restriction endonuclease McrA
MTLFSKRSDALAAGHKQYFNGKPCKQGHIANRKTRSAACMECNRIQCRSHYNRNTEYHKAKTYKWREANTEAYNAHCSTAHAKRRRVRVQTPTNEIERLMIQYRYEDAQRLTVDTGIEHHVDHIWPLARGGPHLPWNLQVLTATENIQKGASLNGF